MIVKVDKSIVKDLKQIKDKKVKSYLHNIISESQKATNLSEINNLKKLKGTKNYYRIRIGDYRVGVIIEGNTIYLIRLLHRKDIYKFFP